MNEDMMKSLVSLIDESLAEIEELKKSDRFSASEVKMGDSEGLVGKDKNGSLDKEDAEKADCDDDEEDEKKDKELVEDKLDEHNEDKHDEDKDEDSAKKMDDDMDKADGKNAEADPNAGNHKLVKSLEESLESQETLMKSYIDDKIGGLEGKLEAIVKAVQDLADSPVPSKGSTYKSVQPLAKSEPEVEALNKSQIIEKLFELKKSGENVDTTDITSAELGTPNELVKIVQKYNIK